MTEGPAGRDLLEAQRALRTPRAAALAGIIFSVFMITALVLLKVSVPPCRRGRLVA